MTPPEAPPTALERRERRPTSSVVFLGALFALPIATCGGIGASKAVDSRREILPTTALEVAAPDSTVEDGAYVRLDARLRHVATDRLPLGDGLVAFAHGWSVYGVQGAPGLYVASQGGELGDGGSVRVEGRACSDDKHLACSVDDGVRLFLRAESRRTGQRTRVVTHGVAPSENVVEAGVGLGIAGVLLLAFLAVAALFARGRRGPRAFAEELVAARPGLDPRALAHALGPAFRVAELSPARLVLLTGLPASSAMLRGATRPEDYPKRVEIWLEEDAYRRASARVRVTEIFAHAAGPPPQLAPQIRAALDATLRRVAHVVASV